MDHAAVVPLPLVLDRSAYGTADGKPSISPSPGAQSASIATTASPYPPPPSSASSVQMMASDASLGRESKRPRILGRPSGAVSRTSTDFGDAEEDQSMDGGNESLDMNYSQVSEMGTQASSVIGVVTSSATPNDTFPSGGTPYWNGNFLAGSTMDKSTSDDGEVSNTMGGDDQMHGGGAPQIYGNEVAWGRQDMTMPVSSVQPFVPRRMAGGAWETDFQGQGQSHQQMQPGSSLASPYDSPSTASNPQMFGEYATVDSSSHRIVPSNAYGPPGSNSAVSAPHQAGGWQQGLGTPGSSTGGPGSSKDAGSAISMNSSRAQAGFRSNRMGGGGVSKDIKPKILASSISNMPKKSPIQQGASTRSERAKTGDRTTHNDVERKYRTNLKDRIAELRAAIPSLQAQQDGESDGTTNQAAPKVSKGTVLSKATEYIQQLEQANRALMSEHQQLMERLQTLEALLQTGERPPQFVPNHGLTLFDPRAFS